MRDSLTTFSAGEVSPALHGRTDLQKYRAGCKTLRNFYTIPQGGVRNRAGTKYIATAGDSAHNVRLIPFVRTTTAAYVIELGQGYARFYTSDAQIQASSTITAWVTSTAYVIGNFVSESGTTYYCLVAHTSGTFATDLAAGKWVAQTAFQIPTPWQGTELAAVKFAQSADTLYLTHPSYAPRQITRVADDNWAIAVFANINGPFRLQNTIKANTITPNFSGAATTNFTISRVQANSIDQYLVLTTSIPNGLAVGTIITVSALTGALATQLNGNSYRVGPILTTSQFYLNNIDGSPVISTTVPVDYVPVAGTLAAADTLTLTASVSTFYSGQIGGLFELVDTIAGNTISDASFTVNTHNSSSIQCGATYRLLTTGVWTGKVRVQTSIDNGATWVIVQSIQSAGADNYDITGETGQSQCLLRVSADSTVAWAGTLTIALTSFTFDWHGVVIISAVATSLSASATALTAMANTTAKYQWSEGSWSTYRGFPAACAFFQDRFVLSSNTSEPQATWLSKTAAYTDFGVSDPLVDSDAFTLLIPGRQLNAVQSIVVMPDVMVLLTSDAEYSVGLGTNGILSGTSVVVTLQGHRGSANLDPLTIGAEIIHVQQMGTVVRNLIFQLATNSLLGDEITTVAQHLFTGYSISAMAYAQEPDGLIYMVRSDGVLLTCAYNRSQEMNAWSQNDSINGDYESVVTIPSSTLKVNEVWLVVNRTIGGSTVRFIETLKPRDQGTTTSAQWFVDAGSQYSGVAATVITGLTYLNGQQVSVVANGFVVANPNDPNLTVITVAAGQITIPISATLVTVGLPITADLITLDMEAPSNRGSMQGMRVKVPRAKIRCWNSLGGYVSTNDPVADTGIEGYDALDDLMLRQPDTNMDTPLPLVTGITQFTLASGYQYGSRLCFRQIDPMPFALLDFCAVVVEMGGD